MCITKYLRSLSVTVRLLLYSLFCKEQKKTILTSNIIYCSHECTNLDVVLLFLFEIRFLNLLVSVVCSARQHAAKQGGFAQELYNADKF